jgi:uncharacterized Zn-finger protein
MARLFLCLMVAMKLAIRWRSAAACYHLPSDTQAWSPLMSSPVSATVPLVPANAENRYEVTRADLPLSCPMPGMELWNSHPKVYLPIVDDGGESTCAYCGAHYVLRD